MRKAAADRASAIVYREAVNGVTGTGFGSRSDTRQYRFGFIV